ncbi:MAG: flagellar hook-associated protein FlgK [Cellvibrionaceae bacterium]
MGSDVLGVSISGLRVSQNAIRTTGHNIANANTQGYSRQSNEINSLGGTASGVGYLGSGSYTARIERVVNEFVVGQVRQDTTLYSELNAYNTNILQVNDLFSNESTGLTKGLESFFGALQSLTDDPTSTSSRQLLISESENLADRFNTLYTRTNNINDGVNQNLETAVENINNLAQTIAELNRTIGESFGSSASNSPNDLLDQRDEALRELSELVSIQVSEQDDQVNVSIGTGIPIIVGSVASELTVSQNEYDPLKPEIFLPGLIRPITDSLTGGEIGGLLDFQNTVIDPTLNELGRIGIVLADEFNRLQSQGITLNNTFGQDFFTSINEASATSGRVLPSINNQTSDQVISLSIANAEELTTSDYRFAIDDSTNVYTVTRLSDNVEIASNIMPVNYPVSIEFDGLSLDISGGTFSNNDEFLIRPTRYAARDFSVNSVQPADIALGSPILTDTNLGNIGSAQISAGAVLGLVDSAGAAIPLLTSQAGQMSPPLIVKFTTPTTYDILDNSNPGNPVQLSPPIRNQAYVPGIANNLFSNDIGQTTIVSNGAVLGLPGGAPVAVNGYPAETFTFTTIDPTTGATSSQNVLSTLNASARTTAGLLDNVDGVTATAFNYLELRDFSVSRTSPLQINLNGEDLVEYELGVIASIVPDPTLNSGEDFNDYLAQQINDNSNLSDLGIYAVSAYDAVADEFYIQVHSTRGDDLSVALQAGGVEAIEINDGIVGNVNVALTNGVSTVVGGQLDVSLADGITMATAGNNIFNAVTAQSSYLGIQANITGTPVAGDLFTLDFNTDATLDNRNGLLMAGLQQAGTIAGDTQNFGTTYNQLVETIGIKTNTSQLNTEAAKSVLDQTSSLRESISGVNLDEEAADLIRFEQLYSANAQVINVARELFDQLLNSL